MYILKQFREERPAAIEAFVARHSLATLVAVTSEGLTANPIPLYFESGTAPGGTLHGHVARANSLWRLLDADAPVIAVFTGASHYISPNWYPAKTEHGKVVPTWNYAAVHAHGNLHFREGDAVAALRAVSELTHRQEAAFADPWRVTDAPTEYVESQLRGIVAFDMTVTRWEAKFKASQHRDVAERQSVDRALASLGMSEPDRREVIFLPAD